MHKAALAAESNEQNIDTDVERLRFVSKAKSDLITDLYRMQETFPDSGIKVLQADEEWYQKWTIKQLALKLKQDFGAEEGMLNQAIEEKIASIPLHITRSVYLPGISTWFSKVTDIIADTPLHTNPELNKWIVEAIERGRH